ncbi:MAG: thiamine pyrophosphate-binding protein [Dehalococcoidia bacterium]
MAIPEGKRLHADDDASDGETRLQGALVAARAIRQQGIEYVFGVIGIPVTNIAFALQHEGVNFVGMRHEQGAVFAAQAMGYLTGKLSAALTVSGPGMLNTVSAFANAWANHWPLLLVSGASDTFLRGKGDFQEAPQIETLRPFAKYSAVIDSVKRLPYYVEQACRIATYGRPGPAYLELPADIITASAAESAIEWRAQVPPPPRQQAGEDAVAAALAAIRGAARPIVIVGKGAARAGAEAEVRRFIALTRLPFLPSPMGKGVVPDDDPLSVAAARTHAIQNADLVFLIGARLNWIMHYGEPPRFAEHLRVVQLDVVAEEIGQNVPTEVALVGDARAVMAQLNASLERSPWQFNRESTWREALAEKVEENRQKTEPLLNAEKLPMGYYRPLREIRDVLPRDAIIVSEGASTMDIGRQVLNNYEPRTRLDAGSFGTMGVGPGFAIAAQLAFPARVVIAVEGDSAFGFDGLEVEIACRLNLPIVFAVFNNSSIYGGYPGIEPGKPVPPTALTPDAHYERVIEAFGGDGYYARTPAEVRAAMRQAVDRRRPALINIVIDSQAVRRAQQFDWLTR